MRGEHEKIEQLTGTASGLSRTLELLRNGFFGTGWILAVLLFLLEQGPLQERPHLIAEGTGSTLVASQTAERTGLQVFWKGKRIPSAAVYTIRVRNRGRAPIAPSNGGKPVTFTFVKPLQVVEARTADLPDSGPPPTVSLVDQTVSISNITLDRGDAFSLEALVIGAPSRKITDVASVAGYVTGDGDLKGRLVDTSSDQRLRANRVSQLLSLASIIVFALWMCSYCAVWIRQRNLLKRLDGVAKGARDNRERMDDLEGKFAKAVTATADNCAAVMRLMKSNELDKAQRTLARVERSLRDGAELWKKGIMESTDLDVPSNGAQEPLPEDGKDVAS